MILCFFLAIMLKSHYVLRPAIDEGADETKSWKTAPKKLWSPKPSPLVDVRRIRNKVFISPEFIITIWNRKHEIKDDSWLTSSQEEWDLRVVTSKKWISSDHGVLKTSTSCSLCFFGGAEDNHHLESPNPNFFLTSNEFCVCVFVLKMGSSQFGANFPILGISNKQSTQGGPKYQV